jgi:catechol 2,3-dioxygenase-like lactoylglutathione lyase family enzyme
VTIDHINVGVANLARSRAFYERALAPFDITFVMTDIAGMGFGRGGRPTFWISDRGPSGPVHIAFTSPDRATVEAFYSTALAAGGQGNGPPGLRPQYHPNYSSAFVLDPDGNNIEAVCHLSEERRRDQARGPGNRTAFAAGRTTGTVTRWSAAAVKRGCRFALRGARRRFVRLPFQWPFVGRF